MRPTILTVDDSKTVRLIVRKTFKPFDCEIAEASNGVEGLAAAAKLRPSVILLDVTMPVMDGVEMLTKLKADANLKDIPVVMLTAEGGRDHVMNIAKLGVRGYIVKPFKEEMMVEKVGSIIELKPATEAPGRTRSILDPLSILVVDDKPAIAQQIAQGLAKTPWQIQGASTQAEAMEACAKAVPDVIVVSLSLPNGAATTLFRALRANLKTKFTPVFALVVKTDATGASQAQQVGFNAVVTKPIDFDELHSRVIGVLNLDTSAQYFRTEGEILVISLPEGCTPGDLARANHYLPGKLAGAVDAGQSRAVIDLHAIGSLHTGTIGFMVKALETCRELAMQVAIVGSTSLATECRGFQETRSWTIHPSIDEAKAHMGLVPPVPVTA